MCRFRRPKAPATAAPEGVRLLTSAAGWCDSRQHVDELRCSFCAKRHNEVARLIAGPLVFICNECVEVCLDIIADDDRFATREAGAGTSIAGSAPVDSAAMAALMDRVAQLSPPDQWVLVMHLLARLRTREVQQPPTNSPESPATP